MSTTATLLSLADEVKFYTKVQSSEQFSDPSDYNRVVVDSVRLHNSNYSISSTSSTVPILEKDVIVLLACSRFNLVRASRFAADSSTTQQAYGTDKNTPFYKCLALSKLQMERYIELCKALGLSIYAGVGSVALTEVTSENFDMEMQTPVEMSLVPPPIALVSTPTNQVNTDGTIILTWTQNSFGNFAYYSILHMTGSEAIYQEWNYSPAENVPPRTNDNCEVVSNITSPVVKAAKLSDLTYTEGTVNRFLVVCASKSGKYSYSNEIAITQPAP